jgi:hypothetical protein
MSNVLEVVVGFSIRTALQLWRSRKGIGKKMMEESG